MNGLYKAIYKANRDDFFDPDAAKTPRGHFLIPKNPGYPQRHPHGYCEPNKANRSHWYYNQRIGCQFHGMTQFYVKRAIEFGERINFN